MSVLDKSEADFVLRVNLVMNRFVVHLDGHTSISQQESSSSNDIPHQAYMEELLIWVKVNIFPLILVPCSAIKDHSNNNRMDLDLSNVSAIRSRSSIDRKSTSIIDNFNNYHNTNKSRNSIEGDVRLVAAHTKRYAYKLVSSTALLLSDYVLIHCDGSSDDKRLNRTITTFVSDHMPQWIELLVQLLVLSNGDTKVDENVNVETMNCHITCIQALCRLLHQLMERCGCAMLPSLLNHLSKDATARPEISAAIKLDSGLTILLRKSLSLLVSSPRKYYHNNNLQTFVEWIVPILLQKVANIFYAVSDDKTEVEENRSISWFNGEVTSLISIMMEVIASNKRSCQALLSNLIERIRAYAVSDSMAVNNHTAVEFEIACLRYLCTSPSSWFAKLDNRSKERNALVESIRKVLMTAMGKTNKCREEGKEIEVEDAYDCNDSFISMMTILESA